jgi:hypothetical protein
MKTLAGLIAMVALASVLVAVPAFAQGPTPTPAVPYGWHGGGPGFGFWGSGPSVVFDAAAKALGLTPEQLFTELRAGHSLADIAKAQDVDPQTVYDAMNAARVEAMKATIQQAVEDGRLTQAQADWILQGLEQGFMPMGPRFGHPFGFGGAGGCPGYGSAPSSAPSVAPSSSSL